MTKHVIVAVVVLASCTKPERSSPTSGVPTVTATPTATSTPTATPSAAAKGGWHDSIAVTPPPRWKLAGQTDEADHITRVLSAPAGACRVTLDVWAGLPPTTGGIMATQSKRRVTVDDRSLDLVKTSQFQGAADVVDALFVNDGRSYGRLVFRDCETALVDEALGTTRLSKAVASTPD